jgi:hypothetical protein
MSRLFDTPIVEAESARRLLPSDSQQSPIGAYDWKGKTVLANPAAVASEMERNIEEFDMQRGPANEDVSTWSLQDRWELHTMVQRDLQRMSYIILRETSGSAKTPLKRYSKLWHVFRNLGMLGKSLEAVAHLQARFLSGDSLYQIFRTEISCMTDMTLTLELSNEVSSYAASQAALYYLLVMMFFVAFPPILADGVSDRVSHRLTSSPHRFTSLGVQRSPAAIAALLRARMPEDFPLLHAQAEYPIPRAEEDDSMGVGTFVHRSWVEKGTVLGQLGKNYVQACGLERAHDQRFDEESAVNHSKDYKELLSLELVFVAACRSFLARLHSDLKDMERRAQRIQGIIFSVFTAVASAVFSALIRVALEQEIKKDFSHDVVSNITSGG